MGFEVERATTGDEWYPCNFGQPRKGRPGQEVSGTIEARPVVEGPGHMVLNALDEDGELAGSCRMLVGYRHSERVLPCEEYQYGAMAAGPAFFWPDDDERLPWILLVRSMWVRPDMRRHGIAKAFAERARRIGLPAYLSFANDHMQAYFQREHTPMDGERSELQRTIARLQTDPKRRRRTAQEWALFVQATAATERLRDSAHSGGLRNGVERPSTRRRLSC